MPSDTHKQAAMMRADYARAKAGKRTRTGMSLEQLREWVAADTQKELESRSKKKSRR